MKTYNNNIPFIAAIGLVGVFIINQLFPFILIGDLLYLGCVVLVFQQTRQIIVSFSIAAFLLIAANTIMNYFAGKINALEWANHILSLALAVFIMVYIAVNERKLSRLARQKEQRYLQSLEEMLFMTSHKVRKPVANIIGLMDLLLDDNNTVPDDELNVYFKYLHLAVFEVDDFLKELSTFIEQSGKPVPQNLIKKKHFVFKAGHKSFFKTGHKSYQTETGHFKWSA